MNEGRIRRRAAVWVVFGVVVAVLVSGGFSLAGNGIAVPTHASPRVGVALAPSTNPPLTINGILVSPNPVTQGSQFSVSVQVSGGAMPYTFDWNPVPANCQNPGNTSNWQCSIGSPGQYTVSVTVMDSGGNRTSASQPFSVSSSGGNSGGGGGSSSSGNSNNNSNGFNLSSFGPLLFYGLIAGIVSFALLVALTVGVIMIAVILARRLPKVPRGGVVCGSCHATAPAGSKFCPACGASFAAKP
jgi:hypothetical protein